MPRKTNKRRPKPYWDRTKFSSLYDREIAEKQKEIKDYFNQPTADAKPVETDVR